jgi:hypothetical protein
LTSRKPCFKGSPGPSNSFSASGRPKMRLGRCRESDVSRGHLDLRTHFLPVDSLIHGFLDIAQAAVWDGKNAENVFAGLGDQLVHRFIDLV